MAPVRSLAGASAAIIRPGGSTLDCSAASRRLESWKEIAAYLGRTEKTARRWERAEGLPVHRLLHHERGSVYAYASELDAWREARSRQPAPAADATDATRPSRRRWIWAMAGVAAVLGIGMAIEYLPDQRSSAVTPTTLAVVPFSSELPDDAGADLGLAVAETIVGHLAGATDVRVRPFAASLRHSRDGEDPATVGRRMDAVVVATGRIRPAGEGLQISVALVDVAANSQIWGTTYDAAKDDFGPTQERIALALREQVLLHANGPLFRPATYQPSNPLSRHPDALRLYLRARGFGRNPGRSQVQSSIAYLREAVRLDPGFTAAYAELGVAHIAITFLGEAPPGEMMANARMYAARALDLEPHDGRGHMVLAGASHWYDHDHAAAERHFRAAIAAGPGLAGARNWYAEFLISMLRFDEALEAGRGAEEQDPGWLEVDTVRGNVHLYSGRVEEAVSTFLKALATEPNHGLSRYFLGQAHLAAGRHAEAVAELRRAADAMGHVPFSMAGLAYALAHAGERAEAEAMLADFVRLRRESYYPAFAIAVAHMGLGETGAALDWLDRAYDERLMGYYMPNVDLVWTPLRSHPRFQDLLRRLGVPQPDPYRQLHR